MSLNTESTGDKRKLRKIAAAAANEALKALPEEEEPRDTELEIDFQAPNEGDQLITGDPTDIFEHAKVIIAKSDFAKFTIKKNGEYVSTKPYPYSIEQLQKEYGAGSYLIFLKQGSNGRIVKQQTIQIADAPNKQAQAGVEFAFGNRGPESYREEANQKPGFMELFIMKSEMEEKNRMRQQEMDAKFEMKQREIDMRLAEAEKAKESSSTEMMKLLMSVQQESAKQMQMMMLESNKTQMNLMTILLTKASEKKEDQGLKAHELAKMLGDAEKNGYSRWKDIAEMIDKKAEQKAEEMTANQGDGDESLTKTLVKGFIPLITQGIQAHQAQGGQVAAQPQYTPQQIEQMRIAENNRRIQMENKRLAQIKAKKEADQKVNQNVSSSLGNPLPNQVVVERDSLGMPRASTAKPVSQPLPRDVMNGHFKEHIQTLVLPIIAEDLTNGIAPDVSSERCLRVLSENKISRKDVLDNFSLVDIIGIVKQFDLPIETKPWFEGFYAHMENKNAIDATIGTPASRNASGTVTQNNVGHSS